jgi:hypothetical protein
MAGRVSISKPYSFDCERVDVGRLVKTTAIATDVRPSEVVHEEEHYVRLPRFDDRLGDGYRPKQEDRGE